VAKDATPYVRAAILTALKADVPYTALVPAARIYPQQRPPNPEWPFTGYGVPIATPFSASCLDGSLVTATLHHYAATTGEGEDTEPGEDMAAAMNAAAAARLGGATLELDAPWPATAHLDWVSSQVMQDGSDGDAFHGICVFNVTVSSEKDG
jgi:hypothetical protein